MMSVSPAFADTLTNDSIVKLIGAGLGPDAVIAKIRSSANTFDLSTQQLIALKQQNVPDAVIAAMLNASIGSNVSASAAVDNASTDPKAPHASGIYLLDTTGARPHMQRVDASRSNQTKSSGILAYALTYGIAHVKIEAVLPEAAARIKTSDARPVFGRGSRSQRATQAAASNPSGSPDSCTMASTWPISLTIPITRSPSSSESISSRAAFRFTVAWDSFRISNPIPWERCSSEMTCFATLRVRRV
jgi:hypothetical protein